MTLGGIAAERAHRVQNLGALDALGHRRHAEAVSHLDRRLDDDRAVHVLADLCDQRPVDLDLPRRKPLQVGQRRVAGPEVVDGYAYAQLGQFLDDAQCALGVLHERALGDLERQQLRGQSEIFQQHGHPSGEILLLEVARGQVDRDPDRETLTLPLTTLL